MTLPQLYSFRRCPYAMRARLALRCAGQQVELREVALRDKPAELLALSPKATVPVLRLPDGRVIDESLDIMRWALARHDPEGWLDAGSPALQQQWIERNDIDFKPLLDRYKYAERHPELGPEQHRAAAEAALPVQMEAQLLRAPWLTGERPSLADMALLPFVRQFAAVDADWFAGAPYPALRAWLERLLGTALFEACMVRQPVWRPGDAPRLFP